MTPKWFLMTLAAVPLASIMQSDAALADHPTPMTLGYAAGYLTDSFQAIELRLVVKAAEQAKVKVLPVANANGDAAWQAREMESLIALGAQAIVVMPTDSAALSPAIERAKRRHVPTVAIDNSASGGNAYMTVRADNVQMGWAACEQIGAAMGGKGEVLSLVGNMSTATARERARGFNSCMTQKFPDISIVERPTDWDAEATRAAALDRISGAPDHLGLFLESDAVMLQNVTDVLRNEHRLAKAGDARHVVIVTIDGTSFALNQVRDGIVDAVVSQPVDLYAKYAVYYAQAAVEHKLFAVGPTNHGSRIEEIDGNLTDICPAKIVTIENARDPTLWGNAEP